MWAYLAIGFISGTGAGFGLLLWLLLRVLQFVRILSEQAAKDMELTRDG